MEYKSRLIIIGAVLLCLLPAVALGDGCVKTLYIDGQKYSPVSATAELSQDDDRLTIGSNGNYQNLVDGLYGIIDEFAIYDGILPDPCIAYHASFSQGDANYVQAVLDENPLLYFQFEDAASPNGAPVLNSGSVSRNGTYIGDPCGSEPNLVAGYIAKGVELYGYIDGNTTCIDVDGGDGAFYPEDGDVTVEFWVYVYDANEVVQWYYDHSNGGTETGYGASTIYYGGTDYYLYGLRGGGSTAFIITYDTGGDQWHHIVVTYDSYGFIPPPPPCDTYECEVKRDDPCLYLRFEDYDDPCDSSGNNHWVEYGDNVTIGPEGGGIGNCIYFPGMGSGNYVAAANQVSEPNPPGDINVAFGHEYGFTPGDTTWEFWYRGQDIPELGDWAVIFNQNWEGNEPDAYNSPIYELTHTQGEDFCYSRYPFNRPAANGGWGYANQVPAMQIPLDNAWHHIVISWREKYNDANQMWFRLSIDGQSVKSMSYPDTSPIPGLVGGDRGEMDHIKIGHGGWRDREGYDNSQLAGYMDEFAIYAGELPIYRVIAHYKAGLPKNCEQLWERGLVPSQYPWAARADRNRDCNIDLLDFADFASEWALCNDPGGGAGCAPNW